MKHFRRLFKFTLTATAQDSGSHRFIRITDIAPEGILKDEDKKFIDISEDIAKFVVTPGDILVARTGATFGKTMLFDTAEPAIFASYLIRLKLPNGFILPKYYWAFAQSENYWKQANALMTGGGQPQFNGNALVNVRVPIPDLDTQRAIVAAIEEEQRLINGTKKLVSLFEAKVKATINRVWGDERELEIAQQKANHESARTTGLYERRNVKILPDEVERILS